MAKIIERQNGERIIVGNNVPEDIQYDTEAMDLFLAKKILKDQQNNTQKLSEMPIVKPTTVVLMFESEEYPAVPVQITKVKNSQDLIKISGTMLTSDFFWLIEKEVNSVKELITPLEHRTFTIKGSYNIKYISAKDINEISVRVNLSLIKTI